MMTKTPPNRRGITFEVGAQLEARDSLKNWYQANIEKIDYEDEKVLIHYRQWSHRYDEWFDWTSPYLRPLERIQLRKEGLQDKRPSPVFQVNEKVLACWVDCRYYPAKVLEVKRDASYTVKFFDGVVKTLKPTKVKPYKKENRKARERDRTRSEQSSEKDEAKENGKAGSDKSKHGSSDLDGERNGEEDGDEDEKTLNGNVETSGQKGNLNGEKDGGEEPQAKENGKVVQTKMDKVNVEGERVTRSTRQQREKKEEGALGQSPQLKEEGALGQSPRLKEEGALGQSPRLKEEGALGQSPQLKEEGALGQSPRLKEEGALGQSPRLKEEGALGQSPRLKEEGTLGQSPQLKEEGTLGQSPRLKEEGALEQSPRLKEEGTLGQSPRLKEEGALGQSPRLPRGNRYRPSEESQRELRKRRVSPGQMPPPKRRRPDTNRNSQSQKQAGPDSVPASPALNPDQTNTQTPTDAGIEAPSDIESILKRQVHLPTTHKYSREPLYRVIKNQPPPILSIELDHNPFKCKAPGCLKSFRKASLLHYHVKYYHADSEHSSGCSMQTRASEKEAGSQETSRRRRTMSGSIHSPLGDRQAANGMNRHRRRSLSERRKENQHTNSRPHEEREWGASETGEKIREKMERDFLLKQKRRKKKGMSKSENTNGEENIGVSLFNSTQSNLNLVSKFPLSQKHKLSYDSSPEHLTDQVHEDDESDWSTVSAEWSDEYMEAELDVTTPMSEQNVSVVTKGSDTVRCICEEEEENDFMIQCDECMCWQHGACMGLFEHNVPDTYNCYICRDPPAQRQSQRYWYDRDWLSSGHMYGLSFLDENYSHQNGKKITATHQLLGDVHHVFEVLNGLQLKMNILQTQTHSDLKLWRQPWKQQEEELGRSCSMVTSRAASPAVNDREGGEVLRVTSVSTPSEKPNRVQMSPTSFQDSNASYISSEHCYQKPRAYYPAVEQRLVVETRGGSELEDSLRSTENLLELEQRYGGPLDPDRAKLYPSSLLQDWAKIHPIALQPDKGLDLFKKLYVGREREVEVETEEAEPSTDIKPDPETDNVLHQQWQINLLDHIESMQNQVTHRMDLIEKELDVLESWLDYTGELEPPDPLTRLPQLKHRIRQMLTDLGTVQQVSLCSSNT